MSAKPDYRNLPKFLLSMLVPAAFVSLLSLKILPETNLPQTAAIPLAIAWGALGATGYYLGRKKGFRIQVIAMILLAGLSLGAGYFLQNTFKIDHSKLLVCQVCGFQSLETAGVECPVCETQLDENQMKKEGYASMDEFLRASQIIYFLPKEDGQKVDFMAPCNCKGDYHKAEDWQPRVTAQEIIEVKKLSE